MIEFIKILEVDFVKHFNTQQLKQEIENSGIVSQCYGISSVDNIVTVYFSIPLNSSDENILNTLFANHVPVYNNAPPKNKYVSVYPSNLKKQKKNAYTVVTNFNYRGSDSIGSINYIEAISYMDSTVTNYKIRVVDKNTGNILVEKTGLNNTTPELVDLGTITNVPSVNSMLEIHVYKTGTKDTDFVYIDEILIYYGN